ncbi:hypothetical protein [Lacihabitans soyangensis]|uniref:Aminopeptidase n=1 Tax=Lacihabitans soyangensis TaxID=869394 RepID=A0AAE3H3L5_9BACT|nr:hypothetical protein [Lacihabitans soyangensis]MCP9764118.1 hypothetical protein [Lacihabitans soyangensis]
MYKKLISFLTIILFCGQVKAQNREQLIFDRIEYIFNLKPTIAKKYWKGFDKKKYDVPLIYYTDTESYIANPPKDFINYYKPTLVSQNSNIRIYKTTKRFDDIPFHMATSFGIDESTDIIIRPTPIMYCSSFEVTSKKIPESTSTEYWVTMIIHEYFHGFQFKHKPYINTVLKKTGSVSEDSLSKIFKNNIWFEEKIKKENDFLLKAIQSKNSQETKINLDSFFISRKERRLETKSKINLEIDDIEKIYETMEGTARYIEYNLQVEYAIRKPDKKLLSVDTAYHSYQVFRNYKIENDPWLFTPGKRYFYATGFNIVRLLDKLKIDYKTRLFKEGDLSLDEILETNYKKKTAPNMGLWQVGADGSN